MMKLMAAIFVFLGFVWTPVPLFAGEPFFLEKPVVVEMQYIKENPYGALSGENRNQTATRLNWKIVPQIKGSRFILMFFLKKDFPFCTLELSRKGSLPIRLVDDQNKILDASLHHFVPPIGYPAPCRVIDFSRIKGKEAFEIMKNAGGRRFKKGYHVIKRPISIDTARENNWIRDGFLIKDDETSHLVLYSFFDHRNDFLFKQLWVDGYSWWVYEETSTSKAWREK